MVCSNPYVFGDSLSHKGNLFVLTCDPATGTGVPVLRYYYDGRFQNGSSYAEHLDVGLGLRGALTPTFLGGTNYAAGGARSAYHAASADPVTGPPPDPRPAPGGKPYFPASLLGQFLAFAVAVSAVDQDALYLGWSGSNDAAEQARLGPGRDAQVSACAAVVGDVVEGLGALGARYLRVPNVSDPVLTPCVSSAPALAALATDYAQQFNSAVGDELPPLDGVVQIRFDASVALFRNPGDYGLTNVVHPCLGGFLVTPPPTGPVTLCGAPEHYLFWFAFYPSAPTHEILAAEMLAAVPVPVARPLLVSARVGLIGIGVCPRSGST